MSDILNADQLDALPDGAQVIDRFGDVSTKRDGLWHSYETAPLWSAKVAKFQPRLTTPDQVLAKERAIAAFERFKTQRHTFDCMNRTRIGVPAVDACECLTGTEEVES